MTHGRLHLQVPRARVGLAAHGPHARSATPGAVVGKRTRDQFSEPFNSHWRQPGEGSRAVDLLPLLLVWDPFPSLDSPWTCPSGGGEGASLAFAWPSRAIYFAHITIRASVYFAEYSNFHHLKHASPYPSRPFLTAFHPRCYSALWDKRRTGKRRT